MSNIKVQTAASKSASKPQVARGHLHCTPASTANHDLSSGRAHTQCQCNSAVVPGKLRMGIPARGAGGSSSAVEPGGEMVHSRGARGGDSTSRGARSRPRSGPLSSDKSRGPRFKAGAVVRGRRAAQFLARHQEGAANIHSVSALLPGACVPCCCT